MDFNFGLFGLVIASAAGLAILVNLVNDGVTWVVKMRAKEKTNGY